VQSGCGSVFCVGFSFAFAFGLDFGCYCGFGFGSECGFGLGFGFGFGSLACCMCSPFLLHMFCMFVCSRGDLWALVGHLWAFWRRSWALLGRCWALLGRPWALLGRSWDALGALLRPCWAYLAKKHEKNQKKNEILCQLGRQNGGQNR